MQVTSKMKEFCQIKDLTPTSKRVYIRVKLVDKSSPRYAGGYRIAIFTASDSTGVIPVLFRNNDIDAVKVGDELEILNGYIRTSEAGLQLNIRPFGSFQIIER